MDKQNIRVIFMGTPELAVPTLESLINYKFISVIAVITSPDKKIGRKHLITSSPIKICAMKNKIPLYQTEKIADDDEFLAKISKLQANFFIVMAFGQILPQKWLDIPTEMAINIHLSLLPKYRGASPLQAALLNNDSKTGITFQKMSLQLDSGDIIKKYNYKIRKNDNLESLKNKLSMFSATKIIEIFKSRPSFTPQNNADATYCLKITKKDGAIFFSKESAQEIIQKFKAYTPWPGIYTHYKNNLLKLVDISLIKNDTESLLAGQVYLNIEKALCIKCKTNSIKLKVIQLSGKKAVNYSDFLKGHQNFINYKFS